MRWRWGLLAVVVLALPAVPAQAADWPQAGGGPQHRSVVTGASAISVATAGHLHVAWSRSFGNDPFQPPFISGTVVSRGRVFFTVETRQELWALRASDGGTLWHRGIGTDQGPLPVVAGGTVYVQGGGWIRAFDAATGNPRWAQQDGGLTEPPVVAAGTVYVTSADGCCAAGLAAYRATDGRLLWVRRIPGISSMVAPAVGAAFDARTMEAVEIVPTAEEAADRTVAMLLEQGLSVGPRSVRPARVAVHKLAPGHQP